MKKRIFSLLLAVTLVAGLLPASPAFAEDGGAAWHGVDINLGNLSLQSCSSTVAYAGYEWVMIGNGKDTVNGLHLGGENCITLFLKATSFSGIGRPVLFRAAYSAETYKDLPVEEQAQYKVHTGTHNNGSGGVEVTAYYAKNTLEGLEDWTHPNEYAGSTVQQAVEAATYEIPAKERAYIVTRDFKGSGDSDPDGISEDGIAGQGLKEQHLWLLSEEEWEKIEKLDGIKQVLHNYGYNWWLRSPGQTENCKNNCGFHAASISRTEKKVTVTKVNGSGTDGGHSRPALILSLPDASDILMLTQTGDPYSSKPENQSLGKDQAQTGGDFIPLKRPDTEKDRLKLTVQDNTQTLTLSAPKDLAIAEDGTLTVSYAFTHRSPKIDTRGKFYLSCMIRNEQGALMGYARLAEPGQGVEGKGELTIDLTRIQETGISLEKGRTYSFLFFTEEVSGPLYTDFASKPVEVKVTVEANDTFTVDRGDVNTHAAVVGTSSAEYNTAISQNPPTFSLDLGSNSLVAVMNGENTLSANTDYTITDAQASAPAAAQLPRAEQRDAPNTQKQVTFTAVYLNSLNPGKHTFTFVMSCGLNPTAEIIISNTRPPVSSDGSDEDDADSGYTSDTPGPCTLRFETNGGNKINSVQKPRGATVDLSAFAPAREGYAFTGWYADKRLTERVTSVRLTGDKTVYAGWEERSGEHGAQSGDITDGRQDCPKDKTCPAAQFADLDLSLWYHDGIHACVERGLMNGTSDTTFSPDMATSRAMLATILWRQAGKPVVNYAMNFSDVDPAAWYGEAVRWAASEGIVSGYGNGRFGTDDPITREQLAVMLYRYAQKYGEETAETVALSGFADAAQVSDWAQDALRWAVTEGIITGTSATTLTPAGQATRAEAAAMLQRYLEK